MVGKVGLPPRVPGNRYLLDFAGARFFFPFLALLLVAYLTHQQPIIFPRYGLILFSLGIPILAWTYFAIVRKKPEWSRRVLVAILLLAMLNVSAQFVGGVGELNRYRAQRSVADYLRGHFDAKSATRSFAMKELCGRYLGYRRIAFMSVGVPNGITTDPRSTLAGKDVEWLDCFGAARFDAGEVVSSR